MADADPYAKYLKPGGAACSPTNAPTASSDTDPHYSKFLPASPRLLLHRQLLLPPPSSSCSVLAARAMIRLESS